MVWGVTLRPTFQRFLRESNDRGWTDAKIAIAWRARTGVRISREQVGERRRQLGLPSNRFSKWRRRQVSMQTREQCQREGVPNLAHVRINAFRAFARRCGWPEDLRPRAVQILNFLYEHGPHTRKQIADAIGMPWKGSRKSLVSNDPEGSYLAHLQKRGLVVRLGRTVYFGKQGGNVNLYGIPPHIKRNLPDGKTKPLALGPSDRGRTTTRARDLSSETARRDFRRGERSGRR